MNPVIKALATFTARLKAATTLIFSGAGGGGSGAVWTWGNWSGRATNDPTMTADPGGSSIVQACVLWIARAFPEAPVRVYDADGEPIDRHPLSELIRRPNPFYSGIVLWMATLIDFSITGNAYWLKVRSGAGRPVELWYTPSWMLKPVWPSDGSAFISRYDYYPSGSPKPIETTEVVHFRFGLDPVTRLGVSPLTSVLREIFTDEEAARFTGSLLANLGVPGVILAPEAKDAELSEDDAAVIKADFHNKFGGSHRGEPMVMTAATKVQVLSFNPEQMALDKLRMIPETRVAGVLGVPAIVAGLMAGLSHATYSNFEQARDQAYETGIIPTQRLLAADLDSQLLPDFGDAAALSIAFDNTQVRVLQDDENAKADRLAKLVAAGVITVAEARRAMGWEVLPEHEVFLTPNTATVTPAASLGAAMAVAPAKALLVPESPPKAEGQTNGHHELKIDELAVVA